MNDKRDFDRAVDRWLDDGSDATPRDVIDAVLLAARSTPQERDSRILRRISPMPIYLRVAAVFVTIAVAGVAALYAFGSGPNVGSVPTTEPTTQPTMTQRPTASPSQTARESSSMCDDFFVSPGAYRATVGTLSVEATVPDGWHGLRDQFYLWRGPCVFSGSLNLEVALVSHVYTDVCNWRGTDIEATTPSAVTAALVAQEGHETIGPTDVAIGGHPASRFEFTFPADFDDDTGCDDGTMWLFPGDPDSGIFNIDPGMTVVVYVIDVDGVTVTAVARLWTEDVTPTALTELDAIVDTLRFEP